MAGSGPADESSNLSRATNAQARAVYLPRNFSFSIPESHIFRMEGLSSFYWRSHVCASEVSVQASDQREINVKANVICTEI